MKVQPSMEEGIRNVFLGSPVEPCDPATFAGRTCAQVHGAPVESSEKHHVTALKHALLCNDDSTVVR